MTLRKSLGSDVQRVHEQVDALLDREDVLLVLFDGARMVSYAQGFGVSPCQLELLSVELERAVRRVVGRQPTTTRKDGRNRETSNSEEGHGRDAVLRQHLRSHDREHLSRVADQRGQSVRSGGAANGDSCGPAGRVLRLARKLA